MDVDLVSNKNPNILRECIANVYNNGLRIYKFTLDLKKTSVPEVIQIPLVPIQEGSFHALRVSGDSIVKPVHGINFVSWNFEATKTGFKSYVAVTSDTSNSRIMNGNTSPQVHLEPKEFYVGGQGDSFATVQQNFGGLRFFYTSETEEQGVQLSLFIREII